MNRPKSVLRKWLLGVLVAIALLLVAAALIPALIDLDDYAQEVADGMSEALGVPVEIESGRLTVLPDLGFVASGISLPDGYGPLSEVNISRIRIDLNLLSLLSGEILVEEIHIKNPRIGMTLDEHARTPDKQYAGPKGARVFDFMQAPPMLPLALDVHVRGADLLIDDRITTPGRPIRTLFRDTRISVKGMNCSTPFQVRFASRVPHREGVGRIKATLRIDPTKSYVESGLFPLSLSGDVGIDGIGCSAFSGYLPEILRKAGLTANCSLNVNVSTQPQKEITLKGSLKADRLHLEHNLSGSDAAGYHDLDLSFTAGIADKGIRLQPVVIKIDENQIAGKLFFLQPPTGGTLLVYEFGAYSLPISTILDLTPSELLPRDEANWIRRIKLSGEIRRFMSGFAGKASDLFYVDEGTFIPRELGIICSIDGLNVRDHLGKLGVRASSGHLSLHEGVLEFDTAKWLFLVDGKELPTTRPPFIDLSIGALDDLIAREGSYSWGELLKGCDGARGSEPMVFVKCHTLELPVEVVNGILDGVPLPPRGAEFIDDCDGLSGTIKGDFDAALFLSGAMEPCVKGKIHIFGSRINYVPLDLPVRLLSVEADISHASANLKTLSVLGGSWPVVSHLDIEIERPYSTSPTISAKGDFRLQQDIGGPFSGEAGPAVLSIDGSEAFANLNASGSLDELKVSLEGDFSEPEIIYGDWLRKAAGENGRMSASARLIEFKSLQIDTARAELGGLVLRGLGEIDFQDEPRWNLSIDLPATNVSELARLSPNVQSLGGEAEVNGWLRLASQPNELAKAPPRSLQAVGTGGLALELNASAIKGLLSSQLMPDAVNEIAEDLNLPSGQARIGVTTGFSTGRLLDAEFKASLELKDVDASHDSFALGLSGFSGNLELTDQILRIRQLSGRLGESEFELDGSIKQPLMFALPGDRWREIQGDIHLVTRPQLKDIRTLSNVNLLENLNYRIPPDVELWATGSIDDATLTCDMSPQGENVIYNGISLNPDRASLQIVLTGRLQSLAKLSGWTGEVRAGESKLNLVSAGDDSPLSFTLTKSLVGMRDLSKLISVLDPDRAQGEFLLDSNNGLIEGYFPLGRIISRLQAYDVSFGLAGAKKQIENLSFNLSASQNVIKLSDFHVRAGESRVSIDAHADFGTDSMGLELKSPLLNTEDFLEAFDIGEPASAPTAGTISTGEPRSLIDYRWLEDAPFLSRGRLDATVSVSKFMIGEHEFGKLLLSAPIEDGVLVIEDMKTDFCRGKLSLDLLGQVLLHCGLSVSSKFKMDSVKLEDLLKLFGVRRVLATGNARITGSIEVCSEDTDELLSFISGQIKVKARDGVIRKFGILSKIFSILDILRVFKMDFRDFKTTGTSYELMQCTAIIKEGVLSTNDLTLVGSSMKATAICDIDLPSETLQGTVGVFLLPVMGSVTHRIPILGPIITQGNKTLLPAYFRIHGSLSNPKVESIQFDKMKESTLTRLRDLLDKSQMGD